MKGGDLERVAAGVLQASGWFVLRRPTDESFQAFELDVLAYRFEDGEEQSLVLESKGGRSGFGDFWKLLGLKTHLEIPRGVLLADPSDPLYDRKAGFGRDHDIDVVDQDAADLPDNLAEIDLARDGLDRGVLKSWERSYRIEDALIGTINDKELWQKYETIKLAKRQLQHLITKGWLERDPWRQAFRLYSRYSEEPKIALTMAEEIRPDEAHAVLKRAMYEGKFDAVQACFYLEHRKRIAVAFAATRCAVLDDKSSRWAGYTPASFHEMVERIADDEAWYLPSVLQVYFLGFGGVICLDVEDMDYEHLASQARCTPKEARHALTLFNDLFPYSAGWYYDAYELSRLKLMPMPLRAAGLLMRENFYPGTWLEMATSEQRQVAGTGTLKCGAEWEQRVLPELPISLNFRR
jgi:hypothetical protein